MSCDLKMPDSKLRLFAVGYEMSSGWLMLLTWIPFLPSRVTGWLGSYYARKADRKLGRMSRDRIDQILKAIK